MIIRPNDQSGRSWAAFLKFCEWAEIDMTEETYNSAALKIGEKLGLSPIELLLLGGALQVEINETENPIS
jgi:hypothetical protein